MYGKNPKPKEKKKIGVKKKAVKGQAQPPVRKPPAPFVPGGMY